MELVLATDGLAGLGGSESYLLTVAEQLERLGHGVTLVASELGRSADVARERGLRVADGFDDLPAAPDAALVQDGPSSVALVEARPGVGQVFVAHSPSVDLQLPPLVDGAVAAIVAMNERVANRMRALALQVDIVRLRQPIDVKRFRPSPVALPASPKKALVVSNHLVGERIEALEAACAPLGIELAVAGRHGIPTYRPERAIADADIVVGYGRSALEGMACGKAALVLDWFGGDGWVTAATYPGIEADGFAGGSSPEASSAALGELLLGYDPAMGAVNRELVTKNHAAHRHACELVELLRRAAGGETGPAPPPDELERLLRVAWRRERRVMELELEADDLRQQVAERAERLKDIERARQRRLSARLRRRLARLLGILRRDPSK